MVCGLTLIRSTCLQVARGIYYLQEHAGLGATRKPLPFVILEIIAEDAESTTWLLILKEISLQVRSDL